LANMVSLKSDLLKRLKIARTYYNGLSQIDYIEFPQYKYNKNNSWHLFVIYVNPSKKYNRDGLINYLAENNIIASVHYKPIHKLSFYKDKIVHQNYGFPNAEWLWSRIVSLPIYPSLSLNNVKNIISVIKRYFSNLA
jgi:dTDP-4-amino-4,6-dideoxygalactose transaminase